MHPSRLVQRARPPAAAAGGRIERCPRRWTHLGTGCSRTHMGSTCVWRDLDSVRTPRPKWSAAPPADWQVSRRRFFISSSAGRFRTQLQCVRPSFCLFLCSACWSSTAPSTPRGKKVSWEKCFFFDLFSDEKSHLQKMYTVWTKSFLFIRICTSRVVSFLLEN